MDPLALLLAGFSLASQSINILALVVGLTVGMFTGAIPGISAANGIALLIPLVQVFNMDPVSALILYASVYYGAKYGGRIASILQNTVGDLSSYTTRLEGYPLALRGQATLALQMTAISSFIGGLASICILMVLAPLLPAMTNSFGPPEYVALIVFVFALLLSLSPNRLLKTLTSLLLGLAIATVGLDWASGVLRFTFNLPELYEGVDFAIVIIGVFALSEAFVIIGKEVKKLSAVKLAKTGDRLLAKTWQYRRTLIGSTVIGFLIGILPGIGAYAANIMAHRFEKRQHRERGTGQGDTLPLVLAPETASSASAVAAFVPLLALGIPGSATTAVILGALMMMNVNLTPAYYKSNPEMIGALICSFLAGNVLLLFFNIKAVRVFPRLLQMPRWALIPIIITVSFVSVYAVQHSLISLALLIAIALFAYCMRIYHYPLAPLALGYVLGKPVEENFRIALTMSDGAYGVFVQNGLSRILWTGTLLCLLGRCAYELIQRYRGRLRQD